MWEKKVVTEESTQSLATVRFDIPTDAPLGTYRLRHQGYYKNDAGSLMPYEGMSSNFEVGKINNFLCISSLGGKNLICKFRGQMQNLIM